MKFKDQEYYIELYKKNPKYGSDKITKSINEVIEIINTFNIKSLFDYGCGLNQTLIKEILKNIKDIECVGYDFAILDEQCTANLINKIPIQREFDLIVSTDCFEHIYEDELEFVFESIKNLNPKVMYFVICNRKAGQILSDGTNAHKTVKNEEWWKDKLQNYFLNYKIYSSNCINNKQTISLIKNILCPA